MVSKNVTPFTSENDSTIYSTNDIKHLNISPGHLASNGASETMVKSFKLGLKKMINTKYISTLNIYLL